MVPLLVTTDPGHIRLVQSDPAYPVRQTQAPCKEYVSNVVVVERELVVDVDVTGLGVVVVGAVLNVNAATAEAFVGAHTPSEVHFTGHKMG